VHSITISDLAASRDEDGADQTFICGNRGAIGAHSGTGIGHEEALTGEGERQSCQNTSHQGEGKMPGSEPYRVCQRLALIRATWLEPGWSSSGRKLRPSNGLTPRMGSRLAVILPSTCSGRPSPVMDKMVLPTAPSSSKTWLRVFQSAKLHWGCGVVRHAEARPSFPDLRRPGFVSELQRTKQDCIRQAKDRNRATNAEGERKNDRDGEAGRFD